MVFQATCEDCKMLQKTLGRLKHFYPTSTHTYIQVMLIKIVFLLIKVVGIYITLLHCSHMLILVKSNKSVQFSKKRILRILKKTLRIMG